MPRKLYLKQTTTRRMLQPTIPQLETPQPKKPPPRKLLPKLQPKPLQMKRRLKNLHHRKIRLQQQKNLPLKSLPTNRKIQETALPRPRSQLQQKLLQLPKPSLKLRRRLQPKPQNPR
jgi:hypothetical protein